MPNPFHIPPLYLQLLRPLTLLARLLDLLSSSLRPSTTPKRNITLVLLSDTHTQIPPHPIPNGDVLIHSGDLTNAGTISEIQAQINWLASLPHKHKIFIAGNHDTWLDPVSRKTLPVADRLDGKLDFKDLVYLENSSVELDFHHRTSINRGRLSVFGSPYTPGILGPEHAFQYDRAEDRWTGVVPDGADVVVTHGPPKYRLDLPGVRAMGDEFLLREVRRVKPLVHCFGHIHAGKSDIFGRVRGGREVVKWDLAERDFEAVMEAGSWAQELVSVRKVCRLVMFGWHSLCGVANELLFLTETPSTIFVNAALMYCDTGRLGNEPQVVHI